MIPRTDRQPPLVTLDRPGATHRLAQAPRTAALWATARWLALGVLALLLLWVALVPGAALQALWYGLIPLLPASFFVTPALWRGICPLATLNEIGNRLGRPRPLAPRTRYALGIAGLSLFYLLVPARHFVFNRDGAGLIIAVAVVGGLAVALGAAFTVRSGFCNGLCPVLPVETLYGMAPLLSLERGRCATCTLCTPRGCYDLAKDKALPQRLGPGRRTARWLATPYGAFFAALPGFMIGYNHAADGPLGAAATIYATTLGWALASLVAVAAVVSALRISARQALPLIAAVAGGLYYWYAGPAIAGQFAAPAWVGTGIQVAGVGLAAVWLAHAAWGGRRATVRDAWAPAREEP